MLFMSLEVSLILISTSIEVETLRFKYVYKIKTKGAILCMQVPINLTRCSHVSGVLMPLIKFNIFLDETVLGLVITTIQKTI